MPVVFLSPGFPIAIEKAETIIVDTSKYQFRGISRSFNQPLNSVMQQTSSQFNLYSDNIGSLLFNLGKLNPGEISVREMHIKNESAVMDYATISSPTSYVTFSLDNITFSASIQTGIEAEQSQLVYIKIDLTEINQAGEIQIKIQPGGV